jgi:hypothetical protein
MYFFYSNKEYCVQKFGLAINYKAFILLLIFQLIGFSICLNAQDELVNYDQLEWKILNILQGENTPSGSFKETIALDLDSEGNIFIVDRGKNRIVKLSSEGLFKTEVGGYGSGREELNDPRDIDAHLTLNVYVTDYNNNRIIRYDSNLNYLNEYASDIESPIYFEMPLSVAVSGQYDIFVLEELNRKIIKANRFNQPLITFGGNTENLGQLLRPYQIATGSDNKIFVSDPGKKSIVIFDYLGNFIRELVIPDFHDLAGIAVNQRNELVVVDKEKEKIYFFSNGLKYLGSFNAGEINIRPIDAFLRHPKGTKTMVFYVLTTEKCYIFYSEKE